jgi:hypothetical protein
MEISCTRCHQPVLAENCYCPYCGLPQLVYEAEAAATQSSPGGPVAPEEVVQDAATLSWKPALRAALLLAVPAGLLSSGISPLGFFGLLWAAAGAAWAVSLYVRNQRAAWITIGAGARIGLVTGLMAAWLAFSVSGSALFVERFALHRAAQIDAEWKTRVETSQQLTQQWTSSMSPADPAQALAARNQVQNWMLSPWGHAGIEVFGFASNSVLLLFFAIGGGILGARWMARTRRPEI